VRIIVHNTAQSTSDYLPSYPPDNHARAHFCLLDQCCLLPSISASSLMDGWHFRHLGL